MLSARGITVSLGGRLVLADVSVSVAPGDRLGIVGPNGIGKTTLLGVLAGDIPLESGSIAGAPKTLTVGFLPQEPDARPGETLREYLARRTGVAAASAELDRLTEALGTDPDLAEAYTDALDTFLALGGDDLDARTGVVCADVGLDSDRVDVEVSRARAAGRRRAPRSPRSSSAGSTSSSSTSPRTTSTLPGLDRLERFVHDTKSAVVVVSHDRAFLDATVDRMVELQEETRRAVEYAGSWTDYVAARDLARTQQYARHEVYRAQRATLVDRARTQRSWSDQGDAQAQEERRAGQEHPCGQDRAQREAGVEGEDHRAGARSARGGGEAVGGLGAAAAARAVGPQRRRRRPARGRGRAAGDLHARPDRPRDRLAGAGRDPRAERQRQDHVAAGAARRAPAHIGPAVDRSRVSRSARWTRVATSCPATAADRRVPGDDRSRRRRRRGRCSRSSG